MAQPVQTFMDLVGIESKPQRPKRVRNDEWGLVNLFDMVGARTPYSAGGQFSANGATADGEIPVILKDPYDAARDYLKAYNSPWDNPPPSMADPASKYPLARHQVTYFSNPTITNGAALNGSAAFLFRGDPYHALSTASISALHAITGWSNTSDMCGSLTANHPARMVLSAIEIAYSPIGELHNVRYSVTNCPPLAHASQQSDISVPTYTSLGVSSTQIKDRLGFDGQLSPAKNTVRLILKSLSSSAATKFMSPVADRTTDGNGAYHVWLYGLSINDMLSLRLIFDLEYYPTGAGVWLDY
jgi:hypothetical protein